MRGAFLDGSNATPESLFKNASGVREARAEDIIRAKELPDATSEEKTMIDRYTKIVLTIIAASLVALVMQNGVQMALAQVSYNDACGTPTHPVCQVSWSTPMPVRSVQ